MTTLPGRKSLPVILERLNAKFPDARYELNWENPLQLLVATILAAQCTDERVNRVTPALFARYPAAQDYADSPIEELEGFVKQTGFYKNKARAIQGACKGLVEHFDGEVPRSVEELTTLEGVARKTANVVLNNAFRIPSGIIVDTHVARLSRRMGLTAEKRPEKIEADLMTIVPQEEWVEFGPAMVLLGRYTCTHHAPKCDDCLMSDLCPKLEVDEDETSDEPEDDESDSDESETAVKNRASKKATTKKKTAKRAVPVKAPAKGDANAAVAKLKELLPADWRKALAEEFEKPYFAKLAQFVAAERESQQVFPPEEDMFNAFKHTPFDQVKVLLLGQDPYHDDGQAHGLCFSVKPGVKTPPSLVNIYKELESDLGIKAPNHGHLTAWADHSVMLLNAVLTVRAHQAASHKEQGWETFTDAVIRALSAREKPVVFLLWGAYAQKKQELIDTTKHRVLTAAHPSPLSAKKFFGSKPFSGANKALKELKQEPVDWTIPPLGGAPTRSPSPTTPPPDDEPDSGGAPARDVDSETIVAESPPAMSLLSSILSAATDAKAAPRSSGLAAGIHPSWQNALAGEFTKPYWGQLERFLDGERKSQMIYPTEDDVFAALNLTPFDQVRVVLLGNEPSSQEGEADGLAFSLKPGVATTAILDNMFEELKRDRGCWIPTSGNLMPWAKQGVLLLNRVLTVRAERPGSHEKKGWETFTDAVLRALNTREKPVVFVFWDGADRKFRALVNPERHILLSAPHPNDDIVGSGIFTTINNELELRGQSAVYWQLFAV